MAKGLRCKHRIRMRNIKRQHYAKKDLERLKKIVSKSSELKDVVTMKTTEPIQENKTSEGTSTDGSMEVDKMAKVINKKTLQDENGHYPEWMNQRAVKKQKQKLNKLKIKKKSGKVSKAIKW
uniref:18 kDa learning-associated protein of slug n=1 Tax=Lehmannia marginata TaxID=381128 RepID=LPS18_LEHMA|nr:RecName: Full=18 kDa learning-associated protein of slug [Lehmannia marginata]AAG35713.1 learning-associated protein LAPS18 [Lehmannia marginata]